MSTERAPAPFAIDRNEAIVATAIFVLVLLAFAAVAAVAGWPNRDGGWSLAVAVALVLALLRSFGPMLDVLQRSGAKVEAPFGIKIDFAGVAPTTDGPATWVLADSTIRAGARVNETGVADLEASAQDFAHQRDIVVDLEDGQAWYSTRLFAVAATATLIGSPETIILVGQKSGMPRQFGGWISPADAVTAFERHDQRFVMVRAQALKYLARLRRHADDATYALPAAGADNLQPQKYGNYASRYRQYGDVAFISILVDQMQAPDVADPRGELESSATPPWIGLAELAQWVEPWLVSAHVKLELPPKERVLQILASGHDVIASTRNGQFEGIIDVRRTERDVVRQLVVRSPE